MSAQTRRRRGPTRRTWAIISLAVTSVTLYSVLVPIQAVSYGTSVPLALLLGLAVCGAPLLALSIPRFSVAIFSTAAFTLPFTVAADRDPAWPWPWSVPALIALCVFLIVVTLVHGWRAGIVAWGISIAGSLAAPLILPDAAPAEAYAADLIVTASVSGGILLIAILIAGRIRVARELTESRELTALEQSRRELVEERTRIARELHDVVAHSMSVIQVQASTARYRIPDLSAGATSEFDDIAATARGSLTEMRRLLGVLRTEEEPPQLVPQQGLGDIPALVDSIRRAGADVALTLWAPSVEPPPIVQITAFRIVQEALSNAVRHAAGSAISVEVTAQDDASLLVRVHNDTAGETPTPPDGAGHGLRGMRERVALAAGSLSVGPDSAGGWTVAAELPLTETGKKPS